MDSLPGPLRGPVAPAASVPTAAAAEAARGALWPTPLVVPPGLAPDAADAAPPCFCCPVTRELMLEPAVTRLGTTYERAALLRWLAGGHRTDPITNRRLPSLEIAPNHALRGAVEHWLRAQLPSAPREEPEPAAATIAA